MSMKKDSWVRSPLLLLAEKWDQMLRAEGLVGLLLVII